MQPPSGRLQLVSLILGFPSFDRGQWDVYVIHRRLPSSSGFKKNNPHPKKESNSRLPARAVDVFRTLPPNCACDGKFISFFSKTNSSDGPIDRSLPCISSSPHLFYICLLMTFRFTSIVLNELKLAGILIYTRSVWKRNWWKWFLTNVWKASVCVCWGCLGTRCQQT